MFQFLLAGLVFVALYLLRPKQDQKPGLLSDVNFPMATDGAPIPLILGTERQDAPNTLWYGNYTIHKNEVDVGPQIFGVTAQQGFTYSLGFDLGLCLGPDVKLRQVWCDKDVIFGPQQEILHHSGGPYPGPIGPAKTDFFVNIPDLFGGNTSGGGLKGNLAFYGGQFDQPIDTYVSGFVPAGELPAYRGQCHAVFGKPFYIGTSNSLKQFSFELSRFSNSLGLSTDINVIGDDLNPMEILYYVLTDDWGAMGTPTNEINITSFQDAAATLASEGNGMSILANNPNDAKVIVDEILQQVEGTMFVDPSTGLINVKLVRNDYIVSDLPVYDESNILSLKNFNRTAWSQTFNEVRITYRDRGKGYAQSTAIVQDMANINAQQRRLSQTQDFPGVHTATLATQIAARTLAVISVPLFTVDIVLDRTAATLLPGDVFVLEWDAYQIASAVMRIQQVDQGSLETGQVTITAIQDSFASKVPVFAPPLPATGTRPSQAPAEIVTANFAWIEVPYHFMQLQSTFPLASLPTSGAAWSWALARQPDTVQGAYSLVDTTDIAFATRLTFDVNHVPYPDNALLHAAIGNQTGRPDGKINIVIESPLDDDTFLITQTETDIKSALNLILIDDEIFGFSTVTNNGDGTYTLACRRALLDTAFADHSTAASVYFFDTQNGLGRSQWTGTQTIYGKFISTSPQGDFEIAVASEQTKIFDQRYDRPIAPDLPKVNGVDASHTIAIASAFVSLPSTRWPISWVERSRLDSPIKFEDDTASTPESGQTYRIEFWNLGAEMVSIRQTGVSGASATFQAISPTSGDGEIRIYAERGGLLSKSYAQISVAWSVP